MYFCKGLWTILGWLCTCYISNSCYELIYITTCNFSIFSLKKKKNGVTIEKQCFCLVAEKIYVLRSLEKRLHWIEHSANICLCWLGFPFLVFLLSYYFCLEKKKRRRGAAGVLHFSASVKKNLWIANQIDFGLDLLVIVCLASITF